MNTETEALTDPKHPSFMTIHDHIRQMRERVEKATPGPWHVGSMNDALFVINDPPRPAPTDYHNDSLRTKVIAKPSEPHQENWTHGEYVANTTFIANARTDLPAILDALEIAVKCLEDIAAYSSARKYANHRSRTTLDAINNRLHEAQRNSRTPEHPPQTLGIGPQD